MTRIGLLALAGLLLSIAAPISGQRGEAEEYLTWSAQRVEAIGRSMYEEGRVGGLFDTRIISTNRSYNYKLAATWLTPEVIRASARLRQLQGRLTPEATRQLVADVTRPRETVILIEIDPREGSGVIPLEWDAFLQPRDAAPDSGRSVRGRVVPQLRDAPALAGTMRRNFDYDRFWAVFPLVLADGTPVLGSGVREAELVVRIYEKEGRVRWTVPDSIRQWVN